MPTLTTKATYQDGIVVPVTKPIFDQPDEVVVTFVKYEPQVNGEVEDSDEALFKQIEPQYREIRREVFKERYPKLYAKYYGVRTKNDN